FGLLCLLCYVRYVQNVECRMSNVERNPKSEIRSQIAWYGLALFFFACGLMSKPMLVTLPFVLLLLDYWPLGRSAECGVRTRLHLITTRQGAESEETNDSSSPYPSPRGEGNPNLQLSTLKLSTIFRLLTEKVPFFALSTASCIVTFMVQGH